MPSEDRTGPLGEGPMTGGGFGRCADNVHPFGPGRGYGRGMFRRRNRVLDYQPLNESRVNSQHGDLERMARELSELYKEVKEFLGNIKRQKDQ